MKHKSLLDYSVDIDLKDVFREIVSVNAYYREPKKRAFEPEHEMDDQLEVELEITNTYPSWFQ
ncbi:hypothetical protein [Nitrosomonas sp. Nm58]|jgi:hypothetical protein|uniref:hypothetical protein n=1 Tax=Nitrosomonas sp. Nm58 TaxID=200126 RepID=UPI000898C098|nr:hypothetical protein [Nitrosomonas sp. Nm58]SDY73535.1 hypothetical protein SAMN05421754_101963 [Nitrosomonas sp. Nm58]